PPATGTRLPAPPDLPNSTARPASPRSSPCHKHGRSRLRQHRRECVAHPVRIRSGWPYTAVTSWPTRSRATQQHHRRDRPRLVKVGVLSPQDAHTKGKQGQIADNRGKRGDTEGAARGHYRTTTDAPVNDPWRP